MAAYLGLSSLQLDGRINDKVLHFLTFFILTVCFYWILDTSRRRSLNVTLIICTGVLGVGSEFLQGLIPDNGRDFDVYDIFANIAGSLAALAMSSWYHKRMVDRKRTKKNYMAVPGDEADDHDLELGEGLGGQESGVVHHETAPAAVSLETELDNWDENAEDAWDEEDQPTGTSTEGDGPKTPSASSAGEADITEHQPETKKRAD